MLAPFYGQSSPRWSGAGLAFVVVLHVAAFYALLRLEVLRLPVDLPVLMIDLIKPVAPELPKPEVVPPRPRPAANRPAPQPVQVQVPPILAAPEASPAPAAAVVAPPPPEPAPLPPIAASVVPAPPPAADGPVVLPRFDADYLDNPKPVYPHIARRMGEEGRVVLRVTVSAAGLPADVHIHAGSGSPRLDQAALAAVRRWRFVPARQGTEAVAASVLVPIVFSLKD